MNEKILEVLDMATKIVKELTGVMIVDSTIPYEGLSEEAYAEIETTIVDFNKTATVFTASIATHTDNVNLPTLLIILTPVV